MRSVGLKVLKNKLSEYVRLAEAGETVLVPTGTGSWRSCVRQRWTIAIGCRTR